MRTKEEIKNALSEIFGTLDEYANTIDNTTFRKRTGNKWSIAQHIDHLTISNTITALSLRMPKAVLQQLYKTNNRPNWNYDEVVWKYQLQLGNGDKATLPFQPKLSLVTVRFVVERLWKNSCNNLLRAMDGWSETELDTYIIPHPIIGKITLRELLFFTIYHVNHHLHTIKHLQ